MYKEPQLDAANDQAVSKCPWVGGSIGQTTDSQRHHLGFLVACEFLSFFFF